MSSEDVDVSRIVHEADGQEVRSVCVFRFVPFSTKQDKGNSRCGTLPSNESDEIK